MVSEVQTQLMKTFAWRSWYPRVALMKLRPQVFIPRKNFNTSLQFHETQAPGFHPVQALHYFIFMKLRPQVFILCKNGTI